MSDVELERSVVQATVDDPSRRQQTALTGNPVGAALYADRNCQRGRTERYAPAPGVSVQAPRKKSP